MSPDIVCVRCNLPQKRQMGQWWTRCSRKTCSKNDVNLVLEPIEDGKMYVRIICKKVIICRINTDSKVRSCSCCKDEPNEYAVDLSQITVINGEKVYGSVYITGFIRRRVKELQEAEDDLRAMEQELTKLGVPFPVVKKKKKEADKQKEADKIKLLAPKNYKTSCNSCGSQYLIPAGSFTIRCKNRNCYKDKFLCRPLPDGLNYVMINCKKTSIQAVFEKSMTVACRNCKGEYAIDNVLHKVLNGQPVFKAERSTGFTQRWCMEMTQIRKKLKYAEAELKKYNKEPPFWKRIFRSSKREPRPEIFEMAETTGSSSGLHNNAFLECDELPPLCTLSMSSLSSLKTPKTPSIYPKHDHLEQPAGSKILTSPARALQHLNSPEPSEISRFSLNLHTLATCDQWIHDSSGYHFQENERLIE